MTYDTLDYDQQTGYSEPVTHDWLRANNELALTIRRGNSTPESRQAFAAREYDRAARALGMDAGATESDMDLLAMVSSALRGGAGGDGAAGQRGRRRANPALLWNRNHEDAYGAGRSLERATQEARFGEVRGTRALAWVDGVRR